MPCAKGMNNCKRSCLHRRMVDEYYYARWSQLMQQEERTLGGRGELELERENGIKQPITFKEWLTGTARSQYDGET